MNEVKDQEVTDIKKDILGFIKSDADIIDCIAYFNCTGKHRFILKTVIEYGRNGLKGGAFSEEQIKKIIDNFDEYAMNDEVISQFLNTDKTSNPDELEVVKKRISQFYIDSDKEKLDKEEAIQVAEGETNAKILRFTNGNKKVYTDDKVIAFPNNNELAKTGFIGAFLISALAATIEISTVLYIILKGM